MNYYLSSFKLGKDIKQLKAILPQNLKTAYVSNALDFAEGEDWVKKFTDDDISELEDIGLKPERFDLKRYFDNKPQLEKDLRNYGIIWVSGGNVFVLRQAMALSGFDKWLQRSRKLPNILYGGYSAGACVVCPSLKGLNLVDSTTHHPYGNSLEIIWEGIGLTDYLIVPHFNSDHPESKAIRKVVKYCNEHGVSYKTIKDGEAIVI